MAGKLKYYKLDDIGIVGKQEKKSQASQRYHTWKTGEVFRKVRAASKRKSSILKKVC